MRLIASLFIFSLVGCASETAKSRLADGSNGTSAGGGGDTVTTNSKSVVASDLKHHNMLGLWRASNYEPVSIDIRKDSIFYSEHFESYKYSLVGDSIYVQYPDFIFSAVVILFNDTLVLNSFDGMAEFVRP